jgi:carbamoyltransferase
MFALESLLGPARKPTDELTQHHRNIARSVQVTYENAFFHVLRHVHSEHGLEALTLSGGCAMNSVANGKVYEHTPFKRLYVQSAAGDAGGAIGAAFVVWNRRYGGTNDRFVMDHAYWGPDFSDRQVQELLDLRSNDLTACLISKMDDEQVVCSLTARLVADGKVVGWFQGRMEWGPRALGNRSIVCDPRRADMKEILNRKIKRRESFRPFAPSILRQAVPEWFETDDDVPFMMQVYKIRPEKRPAVPAVTHVDGTGRLQTVTKSTNPRYFALIEAFERITGVPMVLNTSFNENEPVVCRPEEALDCFLRTKMDALVMGSYMVVRPDTKAE